MSLPPVWGNSCKFSFPFLQLIYTVGSLEALSFFFWEVNCICIGRVDWPNNAATEPSNLKQERRILQNRNNCIDARFFMWFTLDRKCFQQSSRGLSVAILINGLISVLVLFLLLPFLPTYFREKLLCILLFIIYLYLYLYLSLFLIRPIGRPYFDRVGPSSGAYGDMLSLLDKKPTLILHCVGGFRTILL